jgi:hypothetical protein
MALCLIESNDQQVFEEPLTDWDFESVFLSDRKGLTMSRDIKRIKRDILDQFRAMDGEEDDVLSEQWLCEEYLPVLDIFERQDFEKAARQLAAKGFVHYVRGALPVLRLTEKGANLIH